MSHLTWPGFNVQVFFVFYFCQSMEHLNLFHSQEIIEMSGQVYDQPLVRGEERRGGCELKQYFIFRFNLNPLY